MKPALMKSTVIKAISPDTPLASIPAGAVVYDTTDGVVKLCRNVVELNGPDILTLPVLAQDLRFVPWEIEWICNDLENSQVGTNRLIQILNSATTNPSALVYKSSQTEITFQFRTATLVLFSVTCSVPANGFFKIKIKKNGVISGAVEIYVNDTLQGVSATINYSDWVGADKIYSISMTDSSADLRPYQVLNYKASLNNILTDCLLMNEVSGVTLANQCDPTRTATLSDSTAHAKALVPLSLLS